MYSTTVMHYQINCVPLYHFMHGNFIRMLLFENSNILAEINPLPKITIVVRSIFNPMGLNSLITS